MVLGEVSQGFSNQGFQTQGAPTMMYNPQGYPYVQWSPMMEAPQGVPQQQPVQTQDQCSVQIGRVFGDFCVVECSKKGDCTMVTRKSVRNKGISIWNMYGELTSEEAGEENVR